MTFAIPSQCSRATIYHIVPAKLVLFNLIDTRIHPDSSVARPVDIHPTIRASSLLHVSAVVALGFAILEPQLLKEDVRGVIDDARVAGIGSLFVPKRRELPRLDAFGLPGRVAHGRKVAA